MKMEAACSLQALVHIYQTTWCHIPKNLDTTASTSNLKMLPLLSHTTQTAYGYASFTVFLCDIDLLSLTLQHGRPEEK
jgi:hypothetical protein